MNIKDIDGTQAKKVYVRSTLYDSFNYADITKNKFTSTRSVNPLQPHYQVKDEEGKLV
jgi:lipoprotein NlpI